MKLSIIISERNDPFGTLITVRSIMEDLKSCNFDSEIIIVDNSNMDRKRQIFKDISAGFIHRNEIKLIEQPFSCLFSARELGVKNSTGEYIMMLDSHCLLYYKTIKNMMDKIETLSNVGILFGAMCYSDSHAQDAFIDRDIKTFLPIRLSAHTVDLECFKIPLRSMPFLIKRTLWDKMKGYEPLSTNRLVWGGGDFLISFKPLTLGYDNYILTTAGAIHLGPFNDNGFFINSFIHASGGPHQYIGMLTAAYVIGGEPLLKYRFDILVKRYKGDLSRLMNQAVIAGVEFHRWFRSIQTRTYEQICSEFAGTQGDIKTRKYIVEGKLPKTTKFSVIDHCSIPPNKVLQLPKPKTKSWREKIAKIV